MSVFLGVMETANLLSVTRQAIQKDCKAGKYTTRQVKGRGGLRYEIALTSLPEEAQIRYQNQKLEAVAEAMALPAIVEKKELIYQQVDLFELTDRQRDIDRCRATVVKFVEALNLPIVKALQQLNASYAADVLPTNVRYALENALEKREFKGISREVYYGWLRIKGETGCYAPKKREKDYSVQWWHDTALVLYRRAQQPTVQYVVEKLAELVISQELDSDKTAPSYGQVDRYFKDKIGQKAMQKGRNTGMKLRSLQAHKTRTAAGLAPWDAVQSDGWASHFTAPHPISGDYVTLEIWHAHDVATKFIPPLSVGKSESYEVILKCIEKATRLGGVIRLLQTDSTKIVRDNKNFVGDSMLSIADRIGMTISHPKIKGNAQANGIAENFGVWLNNQAKELSSYQHESMDSLTFRRVQNLLGKLSRAKFRGAESEVELLRKEIKRMAAGILFESYQDALDWLEVQRNKWNNRPHSKLPKIYDDATGKKRHQTPQEAFEEFLNYGWQPVALDEEHIVDLLRPRKRVKVSRGKVKPYSSKVGFYHAELGRWEGKEVIVSYDIDDGSSVRVMDQQGALICIALYDAPVGYYAPSAQEVANETRLVSAIKRKEKAIESLKNNAGLTVIDSTASAVVELKTIDYSSALVEESETPKLRTLADLLAESSKGEDFSDKATLLPYWETVSDVDDETKEDVL